MVGKNAKVGAFRYFKQDMSPYSSCMIINARKNSNLKRIITDSRFLNSRLQRVHLAMP